MPIRRPAAIAFAAGLVVVVGGSAGLLLTHHSTPVLRPAAVSSAADSSAADSNTVALPAPTSPIVAPPQPADAAPVARPVSLTIPLIDVKTSLITLGLASGGAMQVPTSVSVAGWFTGSPRPGSVGSSVIVGHVDSKSAHGVFYRLDQLKPGNDVFVKRADGTTAEFRVTEVQRYLKDEFPTAAVYGATPDAELRLITCGGTFDSTTGHYLSNVVVYATEVKLAPGCPAAIPGRPLLTPRLDPRRQQEVVHPERGKAQVLGLDGEVGQLPGIGAASLGRSDRQQHAKRDVIHAAHGAGPAGSRQFPPGNRGPGPGAVPMDSWTSPRP